MYSKNENKVQVKTNEIIHGYLFKYTYLRSDDGATCTLVLTTSNG